MRLEPVVCLGNHQNRCDGDGYYMLCDFHICWTCACRKDDMLWESADAVRRAGAGRVSVMMLIAIGAMAAVERR